MIFIRFDNGTLIIGLIADANCDDNDWKKYNFW